MPLPTTKAKPIVDPGRLIVTIHGISGIGKSTFCSRAEDVIFLPTEPGLNAIEAYKYEPEPGRPLILAWEEMWMAYKELREDTSHRFKTVCIDTGNNAFKMCQAHICKKYGVQHETDIPGQSKGYTLINNEFARLIRAFSGLQMGLYIACHTREVIIKTKTQEWTKQVPDFPDKARGMLISLSDFVLFADVEEYEDEKDEGKKKARRVLHSTPTALHEAKYRFNPLPDPIPLSYARFIEEFKKANGGGTGPKAGEKKEDTKGGQGQSGQGQSGQGQTGQTQTGQTAAATTHPTQKPEQKPSQKADTPPDATSDTPLNKQGQKDSNSDKK